MEETKRSALHPLLTMAAVSVTVFAAVGVATLTGMIPASRGMASQEEQLQVQAPVVQAPVVQAPQPKPQAAKKRVAPRSTAPEPIYREAGQAPIAQAPAVQPGVLGRVESVQEVKAPGEAKGVGVIAGGIGGAVLGHQVGSGRGNKLATILGAVGGALAGNHIEKQARATQRWDITVRLDDGSVQTLSSETQPSWHAGDRVRLHEGKLLPA